MKFSVVSLHLLQRMQQVDLVATAILGSFLVQVDTIPNNDYASSTLFVEFKEPSLTVAKLTVNISDSMNDKTVGTKDVTIKPGSLVIAPISDKTYIRTRIKHYRLLHRSPIPCRVKLIRLMLQR